MIVVFSCRNFDEDRVPNRLERKVQVRALTRLIVKVYRRQTVQMRGSWTMWTKSTNRVNKSVAFLSNPTSFCSFVVEFMIISSVFVIRASYRKSNTIVSTYY